MHERQALILKINSSWHNFHYMWPSGRPFWPHYGHFRLLLPICNSISIIDPQKDTLRIHIPHTEIGVNIEFGTEEGVLYVYIGTTTKKAIVGSE